MNVKYFNKFAGVLYALLLVFCIIMLVAFPDRYVGTALDGIKIWATTVLPSLLPFFFLTALLTKTEVLSKSIGAMGRLTKILYNQTKVL